MKPEATSSRTALLALAAITLTLPLAQAQQTVPNPAANDIYVGFRSADPLQNRSYLVYLGNFTTLFNTVGDGTSISLSLGNLGADLSSEYGSDWFSNPNLRWGIFGTNKADQGPLVFGSRERSSPGNPAAPWNAVTDLTKRNLVGGNITSVLESLGGYRGRTSTANSTVATFQTNANEASSYNFQVAPAGADFGGTTDWTSIEGSFAPDSSKALDLFRVGNSVIRVGTFTITSGGTISFSKGGATNPNADTDGDGRLDVDEVLAGTSPTDPTDFFRVQSAVKTTGNAALTFKPAANRTYKLEYSPDLTAGSWVEITSATPSPPTTLPRYVTTGTAPTSYAFQDTDPLRTANAKGFYRIVVSANVP